jgi:hypothetical protein
MEDLNDARLLSIAVERMKKYDPNFVISSEEMDECLGITEKDLEGHEEVDIE